MEYGSEFDWLANSPYINGPASGRFVRDEWELYRSGRDALKALARIAGRPGTRVLLPALCCESMILPFTLNGCSVGFYKLKPDLRGDERDVLSKLGSAAILVYIRYFGVRPFTDAFLNEIRCGGRDVTIVEDRTHDIIVPRAAEGFEPDAVLASLRKWAALPEGGMLSTGLGSCREAPDSRFGDMRREAMRMKVRYLKNPEPEVKRDFLDVLHRAEDLLDESGEPAGIMPEYEALLRSIDFESLYAGRRANVLRLKERLEPLRTAGKLRFLSEQPENNTLYFPLLLEQRGEVQRAMAQRNIYCPVIWPEPEAAAGVCRVSHYVTEHMLGLPCDQRYSLQDMDFIADMLTEVLG